MGHGVKILGSKVDELGKSVGEEVALENPFAGGAISVGSAVVGDALQSYAGEIISRAENRITARIVVGLHQRLGRMIRANGAIDQDRIDDVSTEDFEAVLNDPAVIEQIGNLDIIINAKSDLILEKFKQSARALKKIDATVSQIDREIQELNKGYREVKQLQLNQVAQLKAQWIVLGRMEQKINNTGTLVAALAQSNLPPDQILALAKAGVLTLSDKDDWKALENAADAQRMQKDFNKAGDTFSSLGIIFKTFGNEQLANDSVKIGNVMKTGGAFAAAIVIGDPLSIFNTGAGLLGALSSFGGGGGDGTAKLLGAVLRELQALSAQIYEYHKQEMKALQEIALKLESFEASMNRHFAELGLDIAKIQIDVRELLYDDVRVCRRLYDEFLLPETQQLLKDSGLLGFEIWYEADNRAQDYTQCLNGLTARLTVNSEANFSGMLRAELFGDSARGGNLTERNNSVRRIEQQILQPTVSYIQKYSDMSDGAKVASKIFSPAVDVCDVRLVYAGRDLGCKKKSEWPSSRLQFSQYNPGQGLLLKSANGNRNGQDRSNVGALERNFGRPNHGLGAQGGVRKGGANFFQADGESTYPTFAHFERDRGRFGFEHRTGSSSCRPTSFTGCGRYPRQDDHPCFRKGTLAGRSWRSEQTFGS